MLKNFSVGDKVEVLLDGHGWIEGTIELIYNYHGVMVNLGNLYIFSDLVLNNNIVYARNNDVRHVKELVNS